MAAQGGKNFSIGLGLQDLLDFSSSGSGDSSIIVIGKDGSKVEVIEYVKRTMFNIRNAYVTDPTNSSTSSS
jgi:hypothetical protein